MGEFKTWLECIEANHFDEWAKETLINEMPHTHFVGALPSDMAFLRGAFVDLGFENLGLSSEEYRKVMLAFGGTGVHVPGTAYRLRHATPGHSLVEPADGTEQAALPAHWRQAVFVMGNDERLTWIGKRVRPDQVGRIDRSHYRDIADGWELL